jgi:hypothetical protein
MVPVIGPGRHHRIRTGGLNMAENKVDKPQAEKLEKRATPKMLNQDFGKGDVEKPGGGPKK